MPQHHYASGALYEPVGSLNTRFCKGSAATQALCSLLLKHMSQVLFFNISF
jgi:hypothetical protein